MGPTEQEYRQALAWIEQLRTRVARLFPNEASLLRLVSALLMETSEEWETGRAYVTFDS